jgi:hypothetical protein
MYGGGIVPQEDKVATKKPSPQILAMPRCRRKPSTNERDIPKSVQVGQKGSGLNIATFVLMERGSLR